MASLTHEKSFLFDQKRVKQEYLVDSYFVELGKPADMWLVNQIAYWNTMWSHRRNGLHKGFVQVNLSPSLDTAVWDTLDNMEGAGCGE